MYMQAVFMELVRIVLKVAESEDVADGTCVLKVEYESCRPKLFSCDGKRFNNMKH